MLVRKKIQHSCNYCTYGAKLNSDEILCMRHGIVQPDYACRKFKYDPCKRVPPKQKASDFSKYDSEDYSL